MGRPEEVEVIDKSSNERSSETKGEQLVPKIPTARNPEPHSRCE